MVRGEGGEERRWCGEGGGGEGVAWWLVPRLPPIASCTLAKASATTCHMRKLRLDLPYEEAVPSPAI